MDHEKLAELIKRYRSGTATADEIELLNKFWAETGSDAFVSEHTEKELQNIERQLFSSINAEIQRQQVDSKGSVRFTPLVYKIAASVLLLMAVSVWWYTSANGEVEIRTKFGEQLAVTLPDQSKVTLNGNSILRYTTDWDENSPRQVWIEGEGFFDVIHTTNHQKFIVHGLSQLDVEVLGTKFNIKTREFASEVMLAEGKVKLQVGDVDTTQTLFLKPGELATVRNKKMSSQNVNEKQYTSWVKNKLFFDRTPLRDLSTLLKDTYGVTLVFADPSLEKRELSGEIWSSSIEEILFAVGETLDLRVEKNGQSVMISSKRN